MTHEYWDGTERRKTGERRLAQSVPYQEYPKWVDGVVYQSAEDEAARKGTQAPAPTKAGVKPQGPPPVSLPELDSPEHAKAEHDKMQPPEKLTAAERRVVADEADAERAHQAKAKTDTHKKK
jgi:hypothetical protein